MQKKCGIILFNEETNEFLLVYGKKSKKWGFPKGHNEQGETEIETATREFMEETGYTIDINQFSWNKKFKIKNNIYFELNIKNKDSLFLKYKEIPDQNEILKLDWFHKDSINKIDFNNCNLGLRNWILRNKFLKYNHDNRLIKNNIIKKIEI